MRRIIRTRMQTHGLFKTLKVQTLYTLSINAKSAPHLTLSYCSAVLFFGPCIFNNEDKNKPKMPN